MKIKVSLDSPFVPIPSRSTEGSAGFDLTYQGDHAVRLLPGEGALLGTGVRVEIPEGFVGLLLPRSSTSREFHFAVGTIDSDYRGEIKMRVQRRHVAGSATFSIEPGDRIGQLVVVPCPVTGVEVVEALSWTGRGDKGFGSTGR